MAEQNLYEILGIKSIATKAEIKAAYKKLSMKHHPDRKGGNLDKFKLIQYAFDVLYHDGKRAEYDTTGEVKQEFDDRAKLFGILSALLIEVIDSAPDADYLSEMRTIITLKRQEMQELLRRAEALVAKRERAIKKIIRTSEGENMLTAAIKADIRNLHNSIQVLAQNLILNSQLMEELENYMFVREENTLEWVDTREAATA